jgi:hypothetical protein
MNGIFCSNCNILCLSLLEVPPHRAITSEKSSKEMNLGQDKRIISVKESHTVPNIQLCSFGDVHADIPLTITGTMSYESTAVYLQCQVFE